MNNEQLTKGKALNETIERLQAQKFIWEHAKGFHGNLQVHSRMAEHNSYSGFVANADHIDFEVLQTLTIATINKKLSAAQKEFEEI